VMPGVRFLPLGEAMKYQSSINIRNASGGTLMFHLEPWGEQIDMPAGTVFTVTAEAEQQGSFEVEHGEDELTLWAWPSAVVKVFCEGDEIGVSAGAQRPAVPPTPDGQSVSSFLRAVLGAGGRVKSDDEI
jgi:hypothetical protein